MQNKIDGKRSVGKKNRSNKTDTHIGGPVPEKLVDLWLN